MRRAMLDTEGSVWTWEGKCTSVDNAKRPHYEAVRETLKSGCHRIFRLGEIVISLMDPDGTDTNPESVYLAQAVDFYEDPHAEQDSFEHMIVVFRWLYFNDDPEDTILPEAKEKRRDPPEDGNNKIYVRDFLMSKLVEQEHFNSVDTMIGKALLCSKVSAIGEKTELLVKGREKTEGILASGTPAELDYTENDDVYLCRWYFAREAEESRETEIPETGRLVALTENALKYILDNPSPDPMAVYNTIYDLYMQGGAKPLQGEEPAAVRHDRPKLGPARKKRPEGVQGGGLVKKARLTEAEPEAGAKKSSVQEKELRIPKLDSPRLAIPKKASGKTSQKATGKVATGKVATGKVSTGKVTAGKSSSGKELPGKSMTAPAPSSKAIAGASSAKEHSKKLKPSSGQPSKSAGGSSNGRELGGRVKAVSATASKAGGSDAGRSGKRVSTEPELKRSSSGLQGVKKSPKTPAGKVAAAKKGNSSKVAKSPKSTKRRDGVADNVTAVPSKRSRPSIFDQWEITDGRSDPEPVQHAAEKMTDHLKTLSHNARNEMEGLWRLLVDELEKLRKDRADPTADFTDDEFDIAREKALKVALDRREKKKKPAPTVADSSAGV